MSVKKSIERAVTNYHKRMIAENTPKPVRKNKKPEKLVETAVLEWCKAKGWDVAIYESSTYDPRSRSRHTSKLQAGHSDLAGVTDKGQAVYIELKAKDRRNNLSEVQRIFLERKIKYHAFAVVVDSVERLDTQWSSFFSLQCPLERQSYLYSCLPQKKVPKDNDLGF